MDPKKRNLNVPIYLIPCDSRREYDSTIEDLTKRKGFTKLGTVSSGRDLTDLAIQYGVEIALLPHFNTEGDSPSQTEVDIFTRNYNR